MSLKPDEIRKLRQRLGWSVAEMARRMGCQPCLIQTWEAGQEPPDSEALNHMHYLKNLLEASSEQTRQTPQVEKELKERRMAQLTHRDLLKDVQ